MICLVGGLAAAAVAVLTLRTCVMLVRVQGNSMAPTYHDGERLLVNRLPRSRWAAGDVVVFRLPDQLSEPASTDRFAFLVKRVAAASGDTVPVDVLTHAPGQTVPPRALVVRGDNPTSLDSRRLGYVWTSAVVGTVVCRWAPNRRRLPT